MIKKILIFAMMFLIFAVVGVSADLYWNYDNFAPPNGFTIGNGTRINFSAELDSNGSSRINGTLCITVNTATGFGACGDNVTTLLGGFVVVDVSFIPYYSEYGIGSFSWRANYTSNESAVLYSNSRIWNIILTSKTLIPIYPINNENVTGDNTNFTVNYIVDVFFPDDVIYNTYYYFYAYGTYFGTPSLDSRVLICEKILVANSTNRISAGYHRITCEHYMTNDFSENFYDELPQNNPKYWEVKARYTRGEVDGGNLFGDTGLQQYNYKINTKFASIFPLDNAVFCNDIRYVFNSTFYDLEPICFGRTYYHSQFIKFYSYLNTTTPTMCGNGNLSWIWYVAENITQSDIVEYPDRTANVSTYHFAGISIGEIWKSVGLTNTTYYGWTTPLTAIHLITRWRYSCPNGSVYDTNNKDFWYIIGVGGGAGNITVYPTYPLPINMTYLMPVLSTYWSSAFQTDTQGGLTFIAIFFLLAMAILVLINMEVFAGIAVFIYGLLVFIRIGYINVMLMWMMVIICGLLIVYFVRRFMLRRN